MGGEDKLKTDDDGDRRSSALHVNSARLSTVDNIVHGGVLLRDDADSIPAVLQAECKPLGLCLGSERARCPTLSF